MTSYVEGGSWDLIFATGLLPKLLNEFTTVVDNIQHLVFKYPRLQKTRYKEEQGTQING